MESHSRKIFVFNVFIKRKTKAKQKQSKRKTEAKQKQNRSKTFTDKGKNQFLNKPVCVKLNKKNNIISKCFKNAVAAALILIYT